MARILTPSRVPTGAGRTLFSLLLVPALAGCGGHGDALESRAGAATFQPGQPQDEAASVHQQRVVAAVGDAIHMLDTGDYRGFLEHYYPVIDLKSLRRRGLVEKVVARAETDPKFGPGMIEVLRHARKHEPKIDAARTRAVFEFEVPGQKDIVVKALEPPVDPDTLKLTGFGPDLDRVLEKSIAALERGEIGLFVERMFPAGELARVQDEKEREAVVARLKASPAAVKQMIADLKAIKDQKPKLEDGGNLAVFTRERGTIEVGAGRNKRRMELPDQTFKFQKVKGSWRLFDNRADLRDELIRLSKLKPPKMTIEVVFERFGDEWRLAELPHSAELLEHAMKRRGGAAGKKKEKIEKRPK